MFYEEVRCKRLLLRLTAPSLPYRWAANPYRGCEHPCVYCYAQGSHQYRGYRGGEEMERRIVVKVNAAAVLREELLRPAWSQEMVALGCACDPYLPAELKYKMTQQMLAVLLELGQPCWLSTKSTLILRDLDLLKALAERELVQVYFRLCTTEDTVWRHIEPDASPPLKRLEAMERLVKAGVPAGALLAPVLPDLTDNPTDLEALAATAAEYSAQFLGGNVHFLKPGSREWTLPFLREQYPHLAPQYARHYRGAYDPAFYTQQVLSVVEGLRQKYGLPASARVSAPAPRRGQLRLGI